MDLRKFKIEVIDLLSLYVLFSQFRPRDILQGICLGLLQIMHTFAPA